MEENTRAEINEIFKSKMEMKDGESELEFVNSDFSVIRLYDRCVTKERQFRGSSSILPRGGHIDDWPIVDYDGAS